MLRLVGKVAAMTSFFPVVLHQSIPLERPLGECSLRTGCARPGGIDPEGCLLTQPEMQGSKALQVTIDAKHKVIRLFRTAGYPVLLTMKIKTPSENTIVQFSSIATAHTSYSLCFGTI
jgi:hypothetical protein